MKRIVLVVLVVVVGMLDAPARVSAHTDFDFSLPTEGASVATPISEITVGFTEEVTLVGNGFEVLDPQGDIVLPTPITDDDKVFRLLLDPPIAGGDVAVRYEVTSSDGHVVSGGFAFTVDAPVPTTTTTTTVAATTVAPAPSTVAPSTTTATSAVVSTSPSLTVVAIAPTTTVGDAEHSGDGNGLYIAIAAAIAVAAAVFLVVRGRSSA